MNGRLSDNRSFVTRATRMSPHQRRAYETLSETYAVSLRPHSDIPVAEVETPKWDAWFARTMGPAATATPLVLDIGFGMGRELAELAAAFPRHRFVGIEVHKPGIGKLLSEIERRGLNNVRIVEGDAVAALQQLFGPASVHAVHLFFPDPWPKKRHHKRRLVRPGFVELVAPLLEPSGYLYTVTDWEDYAWQMRQILDGAPQLKNRYGGFGPGEAWRPETAFERKGRAAGRPIFELVYDRTDLD